MRTRMLRRKAIGGNHPPLYLLACRCQLHGTCVACRRWRSIARRLLPLRLVRGAA